MSVLLSIGLMLLALSILVTIHELGHFWAARMFGIKVSKFYLFFDFWDVKLFKYKRGDTEYGIGWAPLGGYVKIEGMLDESFDEESIQSDPEPWEFRAKPKWQQLIVMLGGIIMNVILGCIIFIGYKYFSGDVRIPMQNAKYGIWVTEDSPVYQAGFRTGDQIISYRGDSVEYLDQISDPNILVDRAKVFEVKRDNKIISLELPNDFIKVFTENPSPSLFTLDSDNLVAVDSSGNAYKGGIRSGDRVLMVDSVPINRFSDIYREVMAKDSLASVNLIIDRDGQRLTFTAVKDTNGKIGIGYPMKPFSKRFDYGFFESIPIGIETAFEKVTSTVKGLVMIFTGNADPSKSLSGPVKIANFMGAGFEKRGWSWFWELTGLLSMVLAVMNLLPIPVLDGGHVVFLSIEAIMGRDIPIKIKYRALQVGFYMVLALMVYIIFNDIFSLSQ